MGNNNYLNTLLFTVIAKGVSVLILGILVFDAVKPFTPLLLTIELGLFISIIWALYDIHLTNQQQQNAEKQLMASKITNASCPDYFVQGANEKGDQLCENNYITPNGKYNYKFTGIDKPIDIDTLFDNKKLGDICQTYFTSDGPFNKIPWSGMKPVCASQHIVT